MGEIKARREKAGMSQAELAQRTGVAQPNIAAYESGGRALGPAMRQRLLAGIRPYPRDVVRENAERIRQIVEAHHALNPRVFGSVARGEDDRDSDLDLLVDLRPEASVFDLAGLGEELSSVLAIEVDIVSSGGLGPDHHEIVGDAVPL